MADLQVVTRLMNDQQFAEAIPLLQEMISSNEDQLHTDLKARLAYCYFRENDFDQSIQLLNECLSIEPENPEYLSDRGLSYFMQGKGQQALTDFDRAQALQPQNPYRYSSRAYIKDALGDTAGAIEDYQKTLELDPQDAIAYNNLGILLEKQGKKSEAQRLYKKADKLEAGPKITDHPEIEEEPAVDFANAPAKPKYVEPIAELQNKPGMNARHYFSTLKGIFTSREGFKEFFNFLMRRKQK